MLKLLAKDEGTKARLGKLTTTRGVIDTPAFMLVGTQGTVKTLSPAELEAIGTPIILGNTYHLRLRPGLEIIEKAGGLHRFIGWERPILTDSGGYQVFSLARIRKIYEDGVAFQSHIDGTPLFLGPEEAMRIQRCLGSDIAMAFDECPPAGASFEATARAVERTLRWGRQCLEQPRPRGQQLFGIVQGGKYGALREQCAREIVDYGFDGYAIGGVSVGEPEAEMMAAVEMTEPWLPETKARYAMGLGTPAQIVEMVARGIDLFDCVLPTRLARNGTAFTRFGTLQIKAGYNKAEMGPIEPGCDCYACRTFSRAYLRHLLKAEEILGLRMLTLHNCRLYLALMATIRQHLAEGTFAAFREDFIGQYRPSRKILAERAELGSGDTGLDPSEEI